ncbi:MAG: hypothetical protein K0S07_857 [Chlamydiales bacterium]|jgi:flagellar biosynthesis/type III secretory pathway chaperone|nr:hypothetical protein [Chlamydiales bacterium]
MIDRSHPIYHMSKEQVLIASLEKEYLFYQSIRELIFEEKELLTHKRQLSSITKIAKKRTILFSFIEEIEQAIKPLKLHWLAKADKTDTESRQISELLVQLKVLIEEILHIDQQNQKLLKSHLLHLKNLSVPKN